MRTFLLALFASVAVWAQCSPAAEPKPFFEKNDIVAFVGGENMVVAAELGYIELFLQEAAPELNLKFRSIAKEGDTVFEQHRDLNYPSLETQLDRMGATVVVANFGLMEGLALDFEPETFKKALVEVLKRLCAKSNRRAILLCSDVPQNRAWKGTPNSAERAAIPSLIEESGAEAGLPAVVAIQLPADRPAQLAKDGVHLSESGHLFWAKAIAELARAGDVKPAGGINEQAAEWIRHANAGASGELRKLIVQKNRLWFNYTRPQNWAFLAGDRTSQPSSRDHLDPSKRWFPAEMEQFVPLIEKADEAIHASAAKMKGGREK